MHMERLILRGGSLWLWGSSGLKRAGQASRESCYCSLEHNSSRKAELLQKNLFFLLRASTNWMRSAHILKGSRLYSMSTDLNFKF